MLRNPYGSTGEGMEAYGPAAVFPYRLCKLVPILLSDRKRPHEEKP